MAKIPVRADDLGYIEAFNYGLVRAVPGNNFMKALGIVARKYGVQTMKFGPKCPSGAKRTACNY